MLSIMAMKDMLTERQALELLRDKCNAAGGAKPWAEANDISHSYVSTVLRGEKPLSGKIVKALGLMRYKTYALKGSAPKMMMRFEDI